MDCSRRTAFKTLGGAALFAASGIASAAPAFRRLAITNVRILPAPFRPPIENATILIEGDRISRTMSSAPMRPDGSTRVIDGGGATVTSGFCNSRVHLVTPLLLRSREVANPALQAELKRAFTRWGFTTVDLVLLRGDPATDVASLSKVQLVVRNGRVIHGDPN